MEKDAPATGSAEWYAEWLEAVRTTSARGGYDDAHLLVGEIVNELYAAGDAQAARLIHTKVWCRLRDERARRVT